MYRQCGDSCAAQRNQVDAGVHHPEGVVRRVLPYGVVKRLRVHTRALSFRIFYNACNENYERKKMKFTKTSKRFCKFCLEEITNTREGTNQEPNWYETKMLEEDLPAGVICLGRTDRKGHEPGK